MADASDISLSAEVGKGVVMKALIAVLGFVSVVAFTRFLSPHTLGGYFLVLMLGSIAARPVVGFAVACKKRFSEVGAERNELITLLLGGYTVALLGTSVIAVLASPWLVSFTGVGSAPIFFVAIFTSVEAFKVIRQLVDGLGQLGVSTGINALRSIITVGIQLGLLVLGYDLVALVVGAVAGSVICASVTLWHLEASLTWPSMATVRGVAGFAKYSVPTEAIGQVYSQLDLLLLGALVTPAAVGYYEVAFRLTAPAAFVASLYGVGVMAVGSNLDSRGESVRDELEEGLEHASILAIPIFFGVVAIGQPLVVTVYGQQYADATWYLIGLALYRVIRTQAAPIGGLVTGLDRPDANLIAVASTVSLNLLLGVALIMTIGPVGVVIATIIAEVLHYGILRYYLSAEVGDVRYVHRLQLLQLAAGIVMFAAVRGYWHVAGAAAWGPLLGGVILGGVVYFGVLLAGSRSLRSPIQTFLATSVN